MATWSFTGSQNGDSQHLECLLFCMPSHLRTVKEAFGPFFNPRVLTQTIREGSELSSIHLSKLHSNTRAATVAQRPDRVIRHRHDVVHTVRCGHGGLLGVYGRLPINNELVLVLAFLQVQDDVWAGPLVFNCLSPAEKKIGIIVALKKLQTSPSEQKQPTPAELQSLCTLFKS